MYRLKLSLKHDDKKIRIFSATVLLSTLTFFMLGTNFSRRHFEIFFIFFLEKRIWQFSCKLSPKGDNLHEVSNTIFWAKIRKKFIISLWSAESAHSMVRVKGSAGYHSYLELCKGVGLISPSGEAFLMSTKTYVFVEKSKNTNTYILVKKNTLSELCYNTCTWFICANDIVWYALVSCRNVMGWCSRKWRNFLWILRSHHSRCYRIYLPGPLTYRGKAQRIYSSRRISCI